MYNTTHTHTHTHTQSNSCTSTQIYTSTRRERKLIVSLDQVLTACHSQISMFFFCSAFQSSHLRTSVVCIVRWRWILQNHKWNPQKWNSTNGRSPSRKVERARNVCTKKSWHSIMHLFSRWRVCMKPHLFEGLCAKAHYVFALREELYTKPSWRSFLGTSQ